MDGWTSVMLVLLVVFLAGGALLGWVSALSLSRMRGQLTELERQIQRLGADLRRVGGVAVPDQPSASATRVPPEAPVTASAEAPASGAGPADAARGGRAPVGWILARIRDHWMVWLGGLSIGLAGIFLVRYSIEQGYLGPTARVLLGITTGAALHVLAEWLRRRAAEPYDALAALAGGASLTLYAAVLAALHLYQLWPPVFVFALLALISLGTMVLALRHGPILAILGILGAFAVPAALGGEAEQLVTVLAYSLVVAMAGFVLLRYVYRDWLWWGTVAGALFWWWVALQAGARTEAWLGLYLAVLAWSMLALRDRNYRLTRSVPDSEGGQDWRHWLRGGGTEQGRLRAGLLLLLVAQAYAIASDPHWSLGPLLWIPLPAVILVASRFNAALRALPWLALLTMAAGLIASAVRWQLGDPPLWSLVPVDPADLRNALASLGLLALLFTAGGAWHLRARPDSALAASLAFVAPLVALALAYVLAPEALRDWILSASSVAVGLVLGGLAGKRLGSGRADAIAFWQIVSAHLAYSLAAVILFEQATLSLALAVQVLSLTWLVQRFTLPHLQWLVKLVLAVVLFRLTLNPWLFEYDAATRWVPVTYGGALLMVWLASRLVRDGEELRLWLQAGAVHLLLLFLHVQIRFWLYDGDVFGARYDFLEAALNTGLWGSFALLYYRRSQRISGMRALYRTLAQILMLLAVGNHLMLATALNPLWHAASAAAVATTPVFNVLLLAYGLPVLLWAAASRLYEPDLRPFFAVLAGIGLWLFVTVEIRHLWQGQLNWFDAMRDGELYTYSAVWLLMAVGTMVLGILRGQTVLYRGGLLLLLLVILKIFFIDMGGLTGLLRAVSFMGLGLALLGLAFLHQRLGRSRLDPASAR